MVDRALREALEQLIAAAHKVKHWYDTFDGGMIVSGESVFELWDARDKTEKVLAGALFAAEPPTKQNVFAMAKSVTEGLVARNIVPQYIADETDTREAIISGFNSLLARVPDHAPDRGKIATDDECFRAINLGASATPAPRLLQVQGYQQRRRRRAFAVGYRIAFLETRKRKVG